jgi:hypothetical protein
MFSRWEKRFSIECMNEISRLFFIKDEHINRFMKIHMILKIWIDRKEYEGKTLNQAIGDFKSNENKVRNLFEK